MGDYARVKRRDAVAVGAPRPTLDEAKCPKISAAKLPHGPGEGGQRGSACAILPALRPSLPSRVSQPNSSPQTVNST